MSRAEGEQEVMRGLLEYNRQGLGFALHTFRELLNSDEAYQIFAVLKKLSIRQNTISSQIRERERAGL